MEGRTDGQPITNHNGTVYIGPAVYSAFGELIYGPNDGGSNRYGYVGAYGYQAHAEYPYLHVGARFYDSSTGRFLQRDPTGINDGTNVYLYVKGTPTGFGDPSGLGLWGETIENWVAENFWMRAPIVSDRLATMSDGEAYAWAGGVSVAGGVGIYYGGKFAWNVRPKWQPNARGFEMTFSRNFRVGWHRLPNGNYPGAGRNLPHWHSRSPGPGGGIGRHRPWQDWGRSSGPGG